MPTASQPTLLDVRTISPRERHPRIFTIFDALAPGESFTLVIDHDPKPLLYQFQNERKGIFDWSPLEESPESWRILITKRPPIDAVGRSVHDYLQWDHHRLDLLMEEVRSLLVAGSFPEAAGKYGEFATGLRRHIRMEEEALFPMFEELTGFGGAGPTAVMRIEHIEIEAILTEIAGIVGSPEPSAEKFETARTRLVAVLSDHNAKEEHVVYPMTDRELVPRQRDDLIKQMQAI